MAIRSEQLVLRYYIRGYGERWHAMCVDLDIAAQGHSLHEAESTLDEMIDSYFAKAASLPEPDRHRLLNRKAPLGIRLKYAFIFFLASVWRKRDSDEDSSRTE
jgi:hypothetical protein